MTKSTFFIAVFSLLLALSGGTYAQEGEMGLPCSSPDASQFDFWIGVWDLTWGNGEDAGSGQNIITSEMYGCVIEENFITHEDEPFVGKSLSVYDSETGLWKQTWVDNQGNYLDFEGGLEEGKMILQREAIKDGQIILQRMVWYNISDQSLDWNWESSDDDGQTWELLWKIHYVRRE